MQWRKLGWIFSADNHSDWMFSHAMIPVAEHVGGDTYRIHFSPRDKDNRGHGAMLEIDMNHPTKVTRLYDAPTIEPGALGCFDDSGALPNALVKVDGRTLLYYTGINQGVTVKIRNSVGIAQWHESRLRFERLYQGPIIDRTKERPHFVATPEVHYDGGVYHAWFTSCVRWEMTPYGAKHYYNLEYAQSRDGIDFERDGNVAIDFDSPHEYALGVPRVMRDADCWRMWFCSRATAQVPTYRIRYAESADGKHWVRKPMQVGLDVSDEGWDSGMICYPFVFDHTGKRYMLYNGNDYGKTGFGIAVLES
jgi:hypothetical protein